MFARPSSILVSQEFLVPLSNREFCRKAVNLKELEGEGQGKDSKFNTVEELDKRREEREEGEKAEKAEKAEEVEEEERRREGDGFVFVFLFCFCLYAPSHFLLYGATIYICPCIVALRHRYFIASSTASSHASSCLR